MKRDPGLQPERTAIAWVRTAVAFAVVGLLASRLLHGWAGLGLASGGLLGMALILAGAGRRAARVPPALAAGRMAAPIRLTLLTTALLVGLNLTAAAVMVLR